MYTVGMSKKPVNIFWKFAPFWLFLLFFKSAASLHFSLASPIGERLLPLWAVGLLIGTGSFVQLVLDVPAGHIMDRYGYRKFLMITTTIFMGAAACLFFDLTRTTYVLTIFVATFGWLFFGPGESAYTLVHAPKGKSGKFISFRDVSAAIGTMFAGAAVPLGLMLSTQQLGYVLFGLMGTALILIWLSPRDQHSVHKETKIATQAHYVRRQSIAALWRVIKKLNPASSTLLLLNLSASIFYGGVWFVVPLVMAHRGEAGALALGLSIFDFAIVSLGFVIGSMADRFNKRKLVFIGLLIFSLAGLIIGFNFDFLFLFFGFLATAGHELAGLSLWSWLYTLDKSHAHDGALAGVLNLALDLGWTIGPIAAGFMYTRIGPSWTIAYASIPLVLLWGLYSFMTHRHKPRQPWPGTVPARPHRLHHKV